MREDNTFACFLQDDSNRAAVAAVKAIAAATAEQFPILLLCGPTGSGKTHLLRAVERHLKKSGAAKRPCRLNAVQFVGILSGSLQNGFSMKDAFPDSDLLLLDEMESLGGRPFTQQLVMESLFDLCAEGKQAILSFSRPIGEFPAIQKQLKTRPAVCLQAEISLPGVTLKTRYIRRAARFLGLPLPEESIAFLAEKAVSPAELGGILQKLKLAFDMTGAVISVKWLNENVIW